MMLQKLRDYAAAGAEKELGPPGYQWRAVRYVIALDRDGRFINLEETAERTARGQVRGVERFVPESVRAYGIKPLLLVDKASYVLGYRAPDVVPGREVQEHQAFVQLVDRCAAETGERSVQAVATFLNNLPDHPIALGPDFDPEARITFRVGDDFPIDSPRVQAFWRKQCEEEYAETILMCLVCGQTKPVVRVHPVAIKAIPGGQSSGNMIVSANADSFLSYGLRGSLIAPCCYDCALSYGNALNALIAHPQRRLRVGGVLYVFWTDRPTPFAPAVVLTNPTVEQLNELWAADLAGEIPEDRPTKPREGVQVLKAPLTGKRGAIEVNPNGLYALALTASGSRVVVRDWIDTTVEEAKRRLGRYFRLQELVDWDGSPGEPLPIWLLAKATVRTGSTEEPEDGIADALLMLALGGRRDRIDGLLDAAVRRCRAEQGVRRERAVLIKMALLVSEEEVTGMIKLEREHPNQAYHCGRLLAVLEAIQRRALGDLDANVVDRFYGKASSAPATVFGTLVEHAQNHLGKLRGGEPGMHRLFQERLEEVMGRIGEFPMSLPLPDQGFFALGYYHQRAADRAETIERAAAARERREAEAAAD